MLLLLRREGADLTWQSLLLPPCEHRAWHSITNAGFFMNIMLCRAGFVLFITSAYILFLNPLILSGGSSGANTGMPASDIVLATAISTGLATATMGLTANYPVSI